MIQLVALYKILHKFPMNLARTHGGENCEFIRIDLIISVV